MRRIVIDASVALQWYIVDEEHSQKALSLLDKYVSNELDILAPSLLEYEVINGLVIAKKRGRIQENKILIAVDGFISLELKLKNLSLYYPKVIHYCKASNRSAYDASYLALADKENIPLITADKGLFNAVKKDLKWVIWLGDFNF
ncbi:MAG: type II toxin-antitoxin system VapC family toxin [Candidatus Aminicenantes bacterium]